MPDRPFLSRAAWRLFLPCWIVLLIVSPYLDRKPTRKPSPNIPSALSAAPQAPDGVGAGRRHRLGRMWSRVWDRAASDRRSFCGCGTADLDCPPLPMACIKPPPAAARVVEGEGPLGRGFVCSEARFLASFPTRDTGYARHCHSDDAASGDDYGAGRSQLRTRPQDS